MADATREATLVLVHGAWHGAWCWERVVDHLRDDHGVRFRTLDLPGHGDSTEPLGDLHTDADVVRAVLDEVGGPVVLVGHSYAGAVITEAGDHPNVHHLVYVTAFMPDADETVSGLAQEGGHSDLGAAMQIQDDGTCTLDRDGAVGALYADCSEEDVAFALDRLCPQRLDTFSQSPKRVAWREKPSTYVICSEDRGVPPALQRRMAERASETLTFETSHSPFFSAPEALAELLAQLADEG